MTSELTVDQISFSKDLNNITPSHITKNISRCVQFEEAFADLFDGENEFNNCIGISYDSHRNETQPSFSSVKGPSSPMYKCSKLGTFPVAV
mmetsp:Transcript_5019/g.7422  ORF Transcript_5019/g.7422 Transcript_5019/m.7422 type:complete len:91 (-) Transcript_5019:430-702(-)